MAIDSWQVDALAVALLVLLGIWMAGSARGDVDVRWRHAAPATVAGWIVTVGDVEHQVGPIDPGVDGVYLFQASSGWAPERVSVRAVGLDGLVSTESNVLWKRAALSTPVPFNKLDLNGDGLVGGPDFGLYVGARTVWFGHSEPAPTERDTRCN